MLSIIGIGFITTYFCFIDIIFLLKILDSYTYKSCLNCFMIFGFLAANFGYYFLFYPLINYFEVLCNFLFESYVGWVFYFCYPYGHPSHYFSDVQPGPQ